MGEVLFLSGRANKLYVGFRLCSGRAQIDTGRTLQLPPPTEVPLNKRYKPTLPPVPPLEETTKRIDECELWSCPAHRRGSANTACPRNRQISAETTR